MFISTATVLIPLAIPIYDAERRKRTIFGYVRSYELNDSILSHNLLLGLPEQIVLGLMFLHTGFFYTFFIQAIGVCYIID